MLGATVPIVEVTDTYRRTALDSRIGKEASRDYHTGWNRLSLYHIDTSSWFPINREPRESTGEEDPEPSSE